MSWCADFEFRVTHAGTAMSTEEMERMLGGLPDPKDRGDAFRATFDSTSALKSIGRTKATKKAEKKAGFDFGSELVDDGGLLRAAVVEPIASKTAKAAAPQGKAGFLVLKQCLSCSAGSGPARVLAERRLQWLPAGIPF